MLDLKKHLQQQAETAKEAVEQYDVDVAAADKAGEVRGIEIGRGQIQLPDDQNPDAQYTQAQMNEAVNTAVENALKPLQAHVSQLESDLTSANEKASGFESDLAASKKELETAQADVEKRVSDEREALKADLMSQYEAQQVAESERETGFRDLLKPKSN